MADIEDEYPMPSCRPESLISIDKDVRRCGEAHWPREVIQAVVANHVVVRPPQLVKCCHHFVKSCFCSFWLIEAIDNVTEVDAEIDFRCCPAADSSLQARQAGSIETGYAAERGPIWDVCILHIADDACIQKASLSHCNILHGNVMASKSAKPTRNADTFNNNQNC